MAVLTTKVKLIALLVIVVAVVSIIWNAKDKQHDAEISQADQRADIAETSTGTLVKVEESKQVLETKHRKETDAALQKHTAGRRDHFDNHW